MGLFDKSRGFREGQAMRDNPAILKQLIAERDARQMKGVLQEALGSAGQEAVPAQYEQQTQQMAGPLMPDQQRGLMDVNQMVEEAQPAQAGSGLLGSSGSPEESRYLQAMKTLSSQGGVGGTGQANSMLSAMQDSVMSNSGSKTRNLDTIANAFRMNEADNVTSRRNNQNTVSGSMRRQMQEQEWNLKHGAGPSSINPIEKVKLERDLRKDYRTSNASFREQRGAMDTINRSYHIDSDGVYQGTGQGDVAIITGFMKMLDPRSIVRETEFAMAQDTAGLHNRLKGMLKSWETGETLSDEARKQMVTLMDEYWNAAEGHMENRRTEAILVAEDAGMRPENVVGRQEYDAYKKRKSAPPVPPVPPASPKAKAVPNTEIGRQIRRLSPHADRVVNQMMDAGVPKREIEAYIAEQTR